MDLLPNGYEIHQPPAHGGKSTKIFTWVQILDFGDINQANMDYLLHAFVIHVWNDSRLLVDQYRGRERPTFLHHKCRDYVWTPYVFYETVKDAKSDLQHLPSSEFRILPDGAVFISTKFIFRAFCPMHLEYFPFDTQTCVFKISMLTSNVLTELQWIGGPDSPYKQERMSVEVVHEPRLLLFHFKEPINESVVDVYTEGLGRLNNQLAQSTDLESLKSHQKAVTIASIPHMNIKTPFKA
ncbi:Gamma-aminobutyric acid receptor subunit alpha-2 [Araneus ventricosus]|uniref:Gamma-aminobutyric acid receptor subunit alpha-2 n=1 Tax=Araneus ventricosus TaxID=182803 RepID=A0A4Y2BE28_ARAVE|nr:Gamma-aminobutyric acid receptor subunit alpha-2 [Araneus ventricosus]